MDVLARFSGLLQFKMILEFTGTVGGIYAVFVQTLFVLCSKSASEAQS